jgi:hypothetical protein
MRIRVYAARLAAAILTAALVSGCGGTSHPRVWQAPAHTPLCSASQLGESRLFRIGHGPVFRAVCDHDGPVVDAWDATGGAR